MIVVVVLLGILGPVALGKFENLGDAAEHDRVDAIFGTVSSYLDKVNSYRYALAGSPDNATFVDIDGVNVNYRNGLVRTTQNNSHVPAPSSRLSPMSSPMARQHWSKNFNCPGKPM